MKFDMNGSPSGGREFKVIFKEDFGKKRNQDVDEHMSRMKETISQFFSQQSV